MEELMVIEREGGTKVVDKVLLKKKDKTRRLFILQFLFTILIVITAIFAKDNSSEIVFGEGISIGKAADTLIEEIKDVFYPKADKKSCKEIPIEISKKGTIQKVKR